MNSGSPSRLPRRTSDAAGILERVGDKKGLVVRPDLRAFWITVLAVCAGVTAFTQTPSITFSSVGLVHGVQMTGNGAWHYGSDQQSGTVTLTAFASGESKVALQLSKGPRVETVNPFTDALRSCTWSGADGVVHDVANHNCWLSEVWFLPQITLQAGGGAADRAVSSALSADGKTLIVHAERHPANVKKAATAQMLAAVSSVDIGVDNGTHLPRWLLFKTHPDNNATVDLQVQIDFSDYRTVNGITVPFHIQKLINHALVLDLQISGVQLM